MRNLGRSTKVDVNKVLRINQKFQIIIIVLIWSFLLINDLKEEGGSSRSNPPGVGCEKLLKNRWQKYSLFFLKVSGKKKVEKPINVIKWLKRVTNELRCRRWRWKEVLWSRWTTSTSCGPIGTGDKMDDDDLTDGGEIFNN